VPAAAAPVLAPAAPAPVFTTASSSKRTFVSIDRFSFDAGGYDAPFVTVYVGLPSVGSMARDLITCDFSASSFDLIVKDLNGKSYRLYKDNLEKDIDPAKSKILVKADKIILKLAKVKQGDYGGFDYWSELTDKKRSAPGSKKKADPQSSIMDLMKEMYDSGDDKMKKVIGETMMKQQQGGLDKKFGKDDLGDLEDSF
jgi:calcyclin binding protein